MLKQLVLVVGVILASLTFHSCLDNDGYSLDKFWMNVATIESEGSGSHYFRLDDGSTLWPVNTDYYTGHNLQDGQRILLNYTILSDSQAGFTHYVKVNGVDPILVKKVAEDMGAKNDSIYGVDPVEIKEIWLGGGYLNIWFAANFGGVDKHAVNLLSGDGANESYRVEFRHNAYNDPAVTAATGLVCFDLSDLPDTNGETVVLTVKVKTFDGEKEFQFDYNSGTPAKGKNLSADIGMGYFEKLI